jgi:hypothetical protein
VLLFVNWPAEDKIANNRQQSIIFIYYLLSLVERCALYVDLQPRGTGEAVLRFRRLV